MKLDAIAQGAIRAVRQTFAKRIGELRVALAGMADLDEGGAGRGCDTLRRILGPPGGATEWISATPFVPPRHLKVRGRNTLEAQVQAELASRRLPAASEVTMVDRRDPEVARFRHFVLARAPGPRPPSPLGVGLRLRFPEPIRGPLCLGYGSHFGLGRFEPCAG
jgi:CRISPR-associated protein Csb2